MKIHHSDPISGHPENAARCRLRICWRRVSVASFVLTFSFVALRLKRKLNDGSVGFSMYFNLVYSSEFSANVSGRKSARKPFCQATKLVVVIDHQFVGNSPSPPLAFLSCPCHMGISLPLAKRLIGGFWDTHGCEKAKSKSCANANSVDL